MSEAGGELGRAELVGPVANPYVAGNPVTGALFVGREDVLRQLEELWAPVGTVPSVVLFGHRRMGKTSILHNLGARFGANTTVINFSMQLMGYVSHTNELLFNLALALYDSLTPSIQEKLGEPEEERFFEHNPYTALRRFVTQVGQIRRTERFLIMIDEFELLEEAIDDGRLDAHVLDFWRGLIQTYSWFVMIFAGLHTLQEMTKDYWNPLFGSVTTIPVSFLRPAAARQLIIQPNPDFPLDYDADAIQEIIRLTNGQPYLIQLICRDLVTRFNRQTFEQGIERERRFTIRDVDAIINAPDFYRHGNAYFTGVWAQATTSTIAGQPAILSALAPEVRGLSLDGIAQTSKLTPQVIQDALERLKQHDIVREETGQWGFTVELMRRWVLKR